MNILIVGGGGREHAIALSIFKSPLTKKLIVAPGNPGIQKFAECIPVASDDLQGQCQLALKINADMVFIGPETPLVLGLKDKLTKLGIKSFGPTANAAQLEGSKSFSRNFCDRHNIPQPKFKYCIDLEAAQKEIENLNGFCVVKANGLAAGKGVVICDTIKQAMTASKEMLIEKKFGDSGNIVLIEERIIGIEASVFVVSDGDNTVLLGTAQDYKRAFDNDKGPNTGGMGAISPAPALDNKLTNEIMNNIILPTIYGMKSEGISYEGILYAGIMLTNDGPKLIEFNCRLGDPETQVILPLLKTDLVEIITKTEEKNLKSINIEVNNKTAITVVIASKGYPNAFKNESIIPSLNRFENLNDRIIFHSGTSINEDNNLVTNGGRVLSVTALGNSSEECREKAYNIVKRISWPDSFYRSDIGKL